MSLAQEAFSRGLFKALRTAGIPVSAAQEGMFLSALKDSARGASQDIKEMTGLSKLRQGAERQIAIGEAQDAVAANQALAQGIGTAAETVGKMVIAQDQMKQSEKKQEAAGQEVAQPFKPSQRFMTAATPAAATPIAPSAEAAQANAEATAERLAEDEAQAMFGMEGLDLRSQMAKKRELGSTYFDEKRKIKDRIETELFGAGGGI